MKAIFHITSLYRTICICLTGNLQLTGIINIQKPVHSMLSVIYSKGQKNMTVLSPTMFNRTIEVCSVITRCFTYDSLTSFTSSANLAYRMDSTKLISFVSFHPILHYFSSPINNQHLLKGLPITAFTVFCFVFMLFQLSRFYLSPNHHLTWSHHCVLYFPLSLSFTNKSLSWVSVLFTHY